MVTNKEYCEYVSDILQKIFNELGYHPSFSVKEHYNNEVHVQIVFLGTEQNTLLPLHLIQPDEKTEFVRRKIEAMFAKCLYQRINIAINRQEPPAGKN